MKLEIETAPEDIGNLIADRLANHGWPGYNPERLKKSDGCSFFLYPPIPKYIANISSDLKISDVQNAGWRSVARFGRRMTLMDAWYDDQKPVFGGFRSHYRAQRLIDAVIYAEDLKLDAGRRQLRILSIRGLRRSVIWLHANAAEPVLFDAHFGKDRSPASVVLISQLADESSEALSQQRDGNRTFSPFDH